ncbi:anti-sigma factor RsiW [Lysobacter enzymogenes]
MPALARTTAKQHARPRPRRRSRRRAWLGWVLLLAWAVAPAAPGAGTVSLVAGELEAQALPQPPGQNGPPSQSQRAIQALTKAMSTVKGKPMRRKSLKRYWPGPRMRRLPW